MVDDEDVSSSFCIFSNFTPFLQESYFRGDLIAGPLGLDSCT